MEPNHIELTAQERVEEDIRDWHESGFSLNEIADEFCYLSKSQINNIIADD